MQFKKKKEIKEKKTALNQAKVKYRTGSLVIKKKITDIKKRF